MAPGAQLLYLHHLFRLQLSEHADKVKLSNIRLKQNGLLYFQDTLFPSPSNNPSCILSVYSVSQLEFEH